MTITIDPPLATMTAQGIRTGAGMGLPFMASSIIYGIAFGLMAQAAGLSGLEATLMSALVFSGTAQVAVLQAWGAATGLIAPFLIVFIANIRYVLMGAALRPWLGALRPSQVAAPLFFLVDGGFVLGMRSRADGNPDGGVLLGACLISYGGWVVGTALGGWTGSLITNPRAIGLDFVVVAFCAASAAVMARGVRDYLPMIAAAIAIVTLDRVYPGPWTVVVGGLLAAVVAAARFRPSNGPVVS